MGMNLLDIVIWWLVLEISGLVSLPLTSYVCRGLKDRGYCISKPLGLLVLTYVIWIVSYGIGYSFRSIVISFLLVAALSSWIFTRKGFVYPDRQYIIKFELMFLFAFLFFVLIRSYSPDIYWTGGEKFMDMTFINSMLRTSVFPPSDPWMSGNIMYYYYFGYLIVSNLVIMSGIMPSITFNLATASFFALSFTAAFGAGFNLTERFNYGLITAFFVNIAGNLAGFFQLMDIFRKGDVVENLFSFNYWPGSRIIPGTINEFPYFSFLQGDLHPHMISITFQLLVILLLLNVIRSAAFEIDLVIILGLSIGFLYPLNTWDYPVYLAIAVMMLLYSKLSRYYSRKTILFSLLSIAAMIVLSYVLYLPYHLSYKLDKTIALVPSGRTSIMFYSVIYGLFLFFMYVFILKKIKDTSRTIFYFSLFSILIASSIALFESNLYLLDGIEDPIVNEFELMIILVPLAFLSILCLFRDKDRNSNDAFIFMLILSGAFISIMCELFFIKDALGDGNSTFIRLNTVFKLYLQNWIIWGICAGYIVSRYRDYFISKKTLGIAALVLIILVSIYPVFAAIGKSGSFDSIPDLNGETYVKKEHPQDYAAILWFRNITGRPVVLQAPGNLYEWNTAITTFTGLPTVIGWAGHELNWRFPEKSDIDTRWSDTVRIYTSGDIQEVEKLLVKYNVSYVYFGEAEARKYGNPELFEDHPDRFEKVFEYGDVRVFEIRKIER